MDLSEDNLLRLINRLLERLHQTGEDKESSHITFNYVAPGAQYVNHIDTQVFDSAKLQKPPQDNHINQNPPKLPDCLATKEAMLLWQSAMDKGWVDENYQPKLSRTLSALLAYEMAERLGIKDKWKTFEKLWHRNNMHSDYNTALSQHQSLEFNEKLKKL